MFSENDTKLQSLRKEYVDNCQFIDILRCKKLFWLKKNKADVFISPKDTEEEFKKEVDAEVKRYAHEFFRDSVKLDKKRPFDQLSSQTLELIKENNSVLNAGIVYKNFFAFIDALIPCGKNCFEIVQIKKSPQIRPEHIRELAFIYYCCKKLNVNIKKMSLMYINKEYVRHGRINPKELFIVEDATNSVVKEEKSMDEYIKIIEEVLFSKNEPDVEIGPHCNNPWQCHAYPYCWGDLPERSVHNVTNLSWQKRRELISMGIIHAKDIPDSFNLSSRQRIQVNCEISSKEYIRKKEIRSYIKSLKYPLHFLDFEALLYMAVPYYDNSRPYQSIPFHFSLHIIENQGEKPKYFSFLAKNSTTPRLFFIQKLHEYILPTGSIIVFNTAFEKKILKDILFLYPEYEEFVKSITDRFSDLHNVFNKYHYYSPKQNFSTSLKKVLPALTSKSYDELEFRDAKSTALEYFRILKRQSSGVKNDNEFDSILEYCKLDTEGMIDILNRLIEITER